MSALSTAAVRKARQSAQTIQEFFEAQADRVEACARALDEVFRAGGRLWTFGNGGSACDAAHAGVEFCHPIFEKRSALPAIALPTDVALGTAIGNDQDFSLGFEQQIRLHACRGDAALGISTSGKSQNVLRALKTAKSLGLLTIGLGGRDGGGLSDVCDHTFTVASFSIHRIQETHATLIHVLWDLVHLARGEEDIL